MPASYSASVLPRGGRWRADVPGAFAILSAIVFVTGVMSSDIRSDPTLSKVLWGSLAATALFFWLARRGWYALRWVVVADAQGVRLSNRTTTIDLGVPAQISHGRFDELLFAGKAHRNTPHLWVAITSSGGRTVLFQKAMGVLAALPDWPRASPPPTREVFSSVGFEPVRFYEQVRGA